MSLHENTLENAALTWFQELGDSIGHGPDTATLRDTLLPKLLSWELGAGELTAKVEGALYD